MNKWPRDRYIGPGGGLYTGPGGGHYTGTRSTPKKIKIDRQKIRKNEIK